MTSTNKSIFLKVISLSLYLYPISLIFSSFLSNLTVFLVAMYGILNITEIKKDNKINNIFVYLFLIFWILISVRSFFSTDILFSLKSSLLFIKYLFFIFGFILVNKKNTKFLDTFFKIFLTVFIIVSIDAFIQFIFGTNLIGYDASLIENNRISGLFGDELILGSYISRLTFLLIALLTIRNIRNKQIYVLFLIFMSFGTAIISGERTALYLSFMSIIFFLTQTYLFKLKYKFIILLAILSTFFLFYSSSEKVQHRVSMTLDDLSTTSNIFTFSEGHRNHYETALNLFKDNIFFGQGANTFRLKCSEKKYFVEPYGCSTHPHNIYIQVLAETGLLGFGFLFLLFVRIIYFSVKHFYSKYFLKKKILTEYELCILACLLVNFWPIIPTGSFFSSSFGNIAVLSLAFAFLKESPKVK